MASGGMTEVGKYRIIDQIGEGAMGVVYRALDPVLNRPVAIKVMTDSVARDDDLRGRFLREAQAAGSLQHPNVVTIYDFGEVDGHLYIAMEFVEGTDLADIHSSERPLTPLQKVDIIIDVLGGLAYAHKRGIIHRDIKPANIRIGEDNRARIMDFGIAHLSSSTMTKTGITVGTPAYMAPEQIMGGTILPATDLFSVGAVMYELLTGKKPFDAESLHSVFYNIVSGPTPSLALDMPGLPPALNAIMQKALAKDPGDRYASALEMANALTPVRRQLDSLARQSQSVSLRSQIETGLSGRPTVLTPLTALSRQRGKLYAATGGGAVLLVAVAVVFLKAGSNAATPRVTPPADSVGPSLASAPNTAPVSPPVVSPAASAAPAETPAATPPSATKSAAKTTDGDAARIARDIGTFRTLQGSVLDARRRAAEAGATSDQLQPGDDHNERATALAAAGKTTEAAAQLNQGMRAWLKAADDARAAAAAAATKARAAEQEKPAPPPVVIPAPVAPPVVSPPPVAAAPQPTAPAVLPATEIATVVAAYARALESRDIAEVRRAYPGVTAAQASGFEQFFASTRSLRATLAITSLDVQSSTAEGRVEGKYDYINSAGKSDQTPVAFRASFRRDGTVWKLVSVRGR